MTSIAEAGVIRQATQVISNNSTFLGNSANIINQSGLSATYTSGVTDFNSFVSGTTHSGIPQFTGWSVSGLLTATFDLGASYDIDRLALWNFNATSSLRGFTLQASNTANFSSFINLGAFSVNNGTSSNSPAQTFTFASTNARYFRFINTSNGGTSTTGFSEIVFGQIDELPVSVPEPSSILGLLVAVGTGGIITKKRQKSVKSEGKKG
jgi:hypothetical protein